MARKSCSAGAQLGVKADGRDKNGQQVAGNVTGLLEKRPGKKRATIEEARKNYAGHRNANQTSRNSRKNLSHTLGRRREATARQTNTNIMLIYKQQTKFGQISIIPNG